MKHTAMSISLVFILTAIALGQNTGVKSNAAVKVTVRAALYDRDLNLKPVPQLVIKLVPAPPSVLQATTVQTNFEGTAETELPPGKYRAVTEKSVELFDKSYLWDFEVDLSRAENTLELSNSNAKTAPIAGGREARVDELAYQYKRVKDAVVTVWTDNGAFDGVVVDSAGLVLTTQKPLERATWMAVQFDDRRRKRSSIAGSSSPGTRH
jgi:hypothetical protein